MDSPSRPAQGFTLLDIKIVKKKIFLNKLNISQYGGGPYLLLFVG